MEFASRAPVFLNSERGILFFFLNRPLSLAAAIRSAVSRYRLSRYGDFLCGLAYGF